MDKTVRLWNMESKVCLKLFAHNDYGEETCLELLYFIPINVIIVMIGVPILVTLTAFQKLIISVVKFSPNFCCCHELLLVTCIQFNPIDDRYFISGSLDSKVRIWSIPEHHVVDWSDLHEMVTAACYTPDGQVQPNDFCIPVLLFYSLHL